MDLMEQNSSLVLELKHTLHYPVVRVNPFTLIFKYDP